MLYTHISFRSFIICTFQIKEDEMAGVCSTHVGQMRNAYTNLVGKPEGRETLKRPRRRWEDNIRKDLRETGCKDVDRMHLACEHCNKASGSI